MADNSVIGRGNALPWRLPADLARFKRLTLGHHLVMGRRTWESIGRPLPERVTVVVSRGAPELPEGVERASSLAAALDIARRAGDDEAFLAGGSAIFAEGLALADRVYRTRVHATPAGDIFFPPFPGDGWRRIEAEERPSDERNPLAMTFEVWERRPKRPAPAT